MKVWGTLDIPPEEARRLLHEAKPEFYKPGRIRQTIQYQGVSFDVVELYCVDCKSFISPTYMLKDSIWRSVAADDEIICMRCIEKRLGRPLELEDFNDAPCNYFVRLLKR